jgi:hypothetical protein
VADVVGVAVVTVAAVASAEEVEIAVDVVEAVVCNIARISQTTWHMTNIIQAASATEVDVVEDVDVVVTEAAVEHPEAVHAEEEVVDQAQRAE